jgi:hypothetical protein
MIPELNEKLHDLRRIGTEPVAEVLRLGIRQQRFRKDLDVDELAQVLVDLHIVTLMFVMPLPDAQEKLTRRAAAGFDLILRGLMLAPPA